jgi:hypothetical protein
MSYTAQAEQNAVNQRFFLAIVDDSGNVHSEYGQLEMRLSDIRDVMAAAAVSAGSIVSGKIYQILKTGNTNFTAIGAANSNPGTIFTATGAGSGTGTAIKLVDATKPAGQVVFREVQFCLSDGTTVYAITPVGGLYYKS